MAEELSSKRQFTYIAGALFLLVAMGAISYYTEGGITGFTTYRCSDSDGGIKPYRLGNARNMSEGRLDYCSTNNKLVEYFCYGKNVKFKEYTCRYGCENGVCLKFRPAGNGSIIVKPTDETVIEGECNKKFPQYKWVKKKCLPSCGELASKKLTDWKQGLCRDRCGSFENELGNTYDCNKCCYKVDVISEKDKCNQKKPQYQWADGRGCLPSCGQALADKGKYGKGSCKSKCGSGEEKTKDTYDCDIRDGNNCCYPVDKNVGDKKIKCPAPEPHYRIIKGKCVPSCGVAKGTCYKGESKCPSGKSKVYVSDCQADGYGICCK